MSTEEELQAILDAGYDAEADGDDDDFTLTDAEQAALDAAELPAARVAFKATVVAECIDVQPKTSKAGNRYAQITWQVTEGEHKGSRIWDNFNLTGKALPFTKQSLTALGLTSVSKRQLVGLVANIQTKIDKGTDGYDDKTAIAKIIGLVTPEAPPA